MKILGIIGGMGPQATGYFYELLIRTMIEKYGVQKNADFFHVVINSIPIPDLVMGRSNESRTLSIVVEEARRLKRAGADFLAMPCNTMHLYSDQLMQASNLPLLSMIDAVVQKVNSEGRKKVALLGSITTMNSSLYSEPLAKLGIELVLPTKIQQNKLAILIHKVISGQTGLKEELFLKRIILSMYKKGAEAVILGCTELPVLAQNIQIQFPVYSSIHILAEECCEAIYRSKFNNIVRKRDSAKVKVSFPTHATIPLTRLRSP